MSLHQPTYCTTARLALARPPEGQGDLAVSGEGCVGGREYRQPPSEWKATPGSGVPVSSSRQMCRVSPPSTRVMVP